MLKTKIKCSFFFYPFSDTVPTVKLATWPMRCEFFDGDLLDGPVPTLFTEDAEAAREGISTAPEKVER